MACSMSVEAKCSNLALARIRALFGNAEDITDAPNQNEPHNSLQNTGKENPATPASRVSESSRVSRVSSVSTPNLVSSAWCETARDAFEERAAILQYEAGLPRATAEYLARSQVELAKN